MKVTGIERRLFPRKLVKIEVIFEDEFGEGVISLDAEDVSMGGLFITSDVPIKVGSYVFLSFILPGSNINIHATGQVVRVARGNGESGPTREGMGVRFVGLSREAADAINEFIS